MKGNMKKLLILAAVSVGLVFLTVSRSASEEVVITVPGTACVYFAGQTQSVLKARYAPTNCPTHDGSGSHGNFHNDTADPNCFPSGNPVIPPFIAVCAGRTLSISADGWWGHGPAHRTDLQSGPGGRPASSPTHEEYDNFGISCVYVNLNTLIAVFLTDADPDPVTLHHPLTTPDSLFSGDDMTSPELQQAFAIGDGLENIDIPEGATRLFFGLTDGYEWNNNYGSVEVDVTLDCISAVINIKPGSYPNSINLCSGGTTPVVIFGSETFDVRTIDPGQLVFASADVKTVGKSSRLLCSIADVGSPDPTKFDSLGDLDGIDDLICHFITMGMTSLGDGSTTATVTITGCNYPYPSSGCLPGADGYYVITASDSVKIVKDCDNP